MAHAYHEPGIADFIFWTFVLFALAWGFFRFLQLRFRRFQGHNWPLTTATIQKAGIGIVPLGKGGTPGSFFGYSFTVQGTRYAGLFVFASDQETVESLQKKLAGQMIQIRYSPLDPDVSYLADPSDPRFGGLTASQNPDWLAQAPDTGIRYPIP